MTPKLVHQPYEPFAYALDTQHARILLHATKGAVDGVHVHYGDRYQEGMSESIAMEFAGWNGEFDVYCIDIEIPSSRLKYAFEATVASAPMPSTLWFGEGGLHSSATSAGVFQLPYLCARDVFTVPAWVDSAVCYQIFPERFENGNAALTPRGAVAWNAAPTTTSMHGGDLPGVTKRLDYLVQLGVNLIYFTPIFLASSNHKYDTFDYKRIDPQFGTLADFKHLVSEAHKRGIRIVLDAVFNHAGVGFAPFQDALKHGRKSRYFDWFFIDGDSPDLAAVNYETFATRLAYMPKLRVSNPEVEAYLLDVAEYWIRECDIDGWRLDVANEIDHVFWRRFREVVKAAKQDALIVGEIWHNSLPWLRGSEFDSVMNYRFRDACQRFFLEKSSSGKEFAADLVRMTHDVPEPAVRAMFNLLGSHDTERYVTLADGDIGTVLTALTCQFTFPGIPMIYYGDEVGMEGGRDPDCRRGMVWNEAEQNAALRSAVARLAHLRQTETALQGTSLKVERVMGKAVVYRRTSADGTSTVFVAINHGSRKANLGLSGEVLFETGAGALQLGQLHPKSAVVVRQTRK